MGASGKPDRATHERSPQAVSAVPVGIPSAAWLGLKEACQTASAPSSELDAAIAKAVGAKHGPSQIVDYEARSVTFIPESAAPYTDSLDAALTLLPAGAAWRRLTEISCSVYRASPYNAAAQVRHDGIGATVALQLCAAIFTMLAAHAAHAQAIEARRAATGTGAVHESAVGQQADAPNTPR